MILVNFQFSSLNEQVHANRCCPVHHSPNQRKSIPHHIKQLSSARTHSIIILLLPTLILSISRDYNFRNYYFCGNNFLDCNAFVSCTPDLLIRSFCTVLVYLCVTLLCNWERSERPAVAAKEGIYAS